MVARIFRPAKTAMQSGQAKTKRWVLDFEPEAAKSADPLMGWTSSSDMKGQIRLFFASKEEAVAYAERKGLEYRLIEPKERAAKTMSYSDNFKFGRVGVWTH
ncbi:MAG: ETC complex I subunit [Hyphomicrobiales bacterium]|nr:ETC complex I subunit [Hyphomicrobiales bacterium]